MIWARYKKPVGARKALVYGLLVGALVAVSLLASRPAHAAPGDLDTTFSNDGKITTSFGSGGDVAQDVAIQKDGRVVVAGYTHNINGTGTIDFALARYNPDGSLDNTFSGDGKITTPVGSGDDYAWALAVQSDGKIVVAGSSGGNFALVRYNPDGTLDAGFGSGGKVTTDFGSNSDGAYDLVVQQDNKIVVAGEASNGSNQDFALARYNADGTLDTDSDADPSSHLDSDGKVTTDFGSNSDYARALTIQADGKIILAGSTDLTLGGDFALARYNADGTPDTSFDTDGKVTTNILWDEATAVAALPDGSIFAAGSSADEIVSVFALTRYEDNGGLVGSFGSTGIVTTDFRDDPTLVSNSHAYDLKVQPDGKPVVVGYFNGNLALTRCYPSGALDNTFSGDGRLTTDLGNDDRVYGLAIQKNGKIVVAGTSGGNVALARYYGGSDTTAPTATNVTPSNLAKNVCPRPKVTATFSDTMDRATVNRTTVKLFKKGSTTAVAATVTYYPGSRKTVLSPRRDLHLGATYKAVVVGGAAGVKDKSGNALPRSKTWTFTVKR